MNFGSPTPVEVAIRGPKLEQNRAFAEKVRQELSRIGALRDLQFEQPLDYPSVDVDVNRELAGQMGVTVEQVGRSLVAATSSSRFVTPIDARVLTWRGGIRRLGEMIAVQSLDGNGGQAVCEETGASARGGVVVASPLLAYQRSVFMYRRGGFSRAAARFIALSSVCWRSCSSSERPQSRALSAANLMVAGAWRSSARRRRARFRG